MPTLKRDSSVDQIPFIGTDRDGDGEIDSIPSLPYVHTPEGGWVPMKVDQEGRQIVVAKKNYTVNDISQDGDVLPGQNEIIYLYASNKTIAKVLLAYINIQPVPNATEGIHRLIVGIGDTLSKNRILDIAEVYNRAISMSELFKNDEDPKISKFKQLIEQGRLLFGENNTNRLILVYSNETNASQTITRYLNITSLEEAVE